MNIEMERMERKSCQKILVFGHLNPDTDAIGAAIAFDTCNKP